MSTPSFIKLGAAGKPLSLRAKSWVAVFDEANNLFWPRHASPERLPWKQAIKVAKQVDLLGLTGWCPPTRVQLLTLIDDARHNPAIDTRFFPECQSGWYWTSTTYAPSPGDFAWLVNFYGGNSFWGHQSGVGFVRAVRPGQLSDLGSEPKSRRAR